MADFLALGKAFAPVQCLDGLARREERSLTRESRHPHGRGGFCGPAALRLRGKARKGFPPSAAPCGGRKIRRVMAPIGFRIGSKEAQY